MITNRTPEAHAAVLENSVASIRTASTRLPVCAERCCSGHRWRRRMGRRGLRSETGLLYVNSNEQPWIIRLVTHDTKSLYKNNCGGCHGDDRKGAPPTFPPLVDIGKRRRAPNWRASSAKARAACRASIIWAEASTRLSTF